MTPLRAVLRQRKEFGRPDLPLLGVSLDVGVRIRRDDDGRPAPSQDLDGYKVVRPDDIVMNALGKPHGSIGRSQSFGITSPAYWVLVPDERLDPQFAHHLLRSSSMVSAYQHLGKNQPPNQFDISWESFRSIEVWLPACSTQRRIADYLDAECGRLDRLIELRAQQIALAFERRDVVVTERVTRGIAPSTTVIDTAMPWIGKAPSHWVVQTIRRLDPHIESGTSVNASDVVPADDELGVLKTGAASKGWFDPDESKTVWGEDHGRVTCPVVDGALLLNRANTPALVGTTAFVNRAPRNLYLSDKLWQIKFGRASERFVWWWTKTSVYRKQVESFCVGASSSMQNLAKDDFRSIAIALPPIEEQELIATDLEARVGELQRAITAMERSIELLRERKQALITAAVTGEFDVTAASGRGV